MRVRRLCAYMWGGSIYEPHLHTHRTDHHHNSWTVNPILGLAFQLLDQMKFMNHWMLPGVVTGAEAIANQDNFGATKLDHAMRCGTFCHGSLAPQKQVQCREGTARSARQLRTERQAVVQGGYGQWCRALTAVVQGSYSGGRAVYRQEGRQWYRAYPGKQVSDRQASSGSACLGLMEGPEIQQLVCNCLSYCRICRHIESTCQTAQSDEFLVTADWNSVTSMLCC